MKQLAPIALFAYNRPVHLKRTLEALASNELARESHLTIFCDGPKEVATSEERALVAEVREIAHSRDWCGTVTIRERGENAGLARSIRSGIDELLTMSDRVIVLEDDIVTAPGFLLYMNAALTAYQADENVMHIAGYLPHTSFAQLLPSTFFTTLMSCWGWGTWKRAWTRARWNPRELLEELDSLPFGRRGFDLDGNTDFSSQLLRNAEGQLNTWAVMWGASIYLAHGLCLVPGASLVRNIGTDGSGEHFSHGHDSQYDVKLALGARVVRRKIRESGCGRFYLRSFYKYGPNAGLGARMKTKVRGVRSKIATAARALT